MTDTDPLREMIAEDQEWIEARADQLFRDSERQGGGVRHATIMPQDFRDYFVARAAWERARAALAAAPQPMGCGLPCGYDCNGACFDAVAPQPVPADRQALMDLIWDAAKDGDKFLESGGPEVIADALLARGLRLPGGDETMAKLKPEGEPNEGV